MTYLLAALNVLLLTILIVTHLRNKRRQTLAEATAWDHQKFAQQQYQRAIDAETAQRTLANVVFDLKENLHHLRTALEVQKASTKTEVENAFKRGEKHGRADALKRSKFVSHGFTSENFAPLLQDHDWNPNDFRHMGDPIDYLVVDGMSKIRQLGAKAQVDEVVLLDIKTGNSKLNTIQRRIRDAVLAGKVRFATYNTDTGKLRKWPADPEPKQLELPFS